MFAISGLSLWIYLGLELLHLFKQEDSALSQTVWCSRIIFMIPLVIKWMQRFTRFMGWTTSSYVVLGIFMLMVLVIVYVWWPLAKMVMSYIDWHGDWWRYMDWLLVGIFLFMSITIMAGADLRRDALIILVGAIGGLVIEGWGTQTYLWWYFTAQRPPLWIIPAWPIASLTIDRMARFLNRHLPNTVGKWNQFNQIAYWLTFAIFMALMLIFVMPTIGSSMTVLAILLVILMIFSSTDHRFALLTFIAGSGLGYFLETWGTTRECWTYYTFQKPPLFAILAHGMAAVAFWRSGLILNLGWQKIRSGFYLSIRFGKKSAAPPFKADVDGQGSGQM